MDSINQFDNVRFQDVEFSNQGITLFSYQSRLLSVDKKDVRRIILKHGFQSERPVAEIAFGIFVIGLGIYFFVNFLLIIVVREIIYIDDLLSLSLLPIGGWFIMDGFRKRFYFEVVLDNDKRKLPLRKNSDKSELQKFIRMASQLGYGIDATVLDERI